MKLSIKELQVGQKLISVFKKDENAGWMNPVSALRVGWENKYLPKDTIISVIEKDKSRVKLSLDNDTNVIDKEQNVIGQLKKGTQLSVYISDLRSAVKEYGEILPHPDIFQYRIFKGDKPIKPKYFDDMGKIKSSLLFMFPYFDDEWELRNKYSDINPELEDGGIPELGYTDIKLNQEDCKDVYVIKYTNKKNPEKVDFNVYDYFKQSTLLHGVTYKFGEAARKMFKEQLETGEYKYILVYIPDEYRNESLKKNYLDYSSIKEKDYIKDIIKKSGIKDLKKATKCGKTAIAVKSLDDLDTLMTLLKTNEYIILDCDGDELVKKSDRFIKLTILGFNEK